MSAAPPRPNILTWFCDLCGKAFPATVYEATIAKFICPACRTKKKEEEVE